MSIQDAAHLGHLMQVNIADIRGLSQRTVTILKRAGIRHVADVRDALVCHGKIPGVANERRSEIKLALESQGSWPPDIHEHCRSHLFVAVRAHKMGFAEGKAEAERVAMNQTLDFQATTQFTVASMKDRVLEGYEKHIDFVGFWAFIKYDVPGIGQMIAKCEILFSLESMSKMLRAWNPALRESVRGTLCLRFGDAPPREGEIVMKFDSCSGTLFLKPPDKNAQDRFDDEESIASKKISDIDRLTM
jgi:hypothetical protein